MSNPSIRNIICILVGTMVVLAAGIACATEDDFGEARQIQGEHFVIYYSPQSDLYGLIQELNIGPADRILVGKFKEGKVFDESQLADAVEALFLQTCDILDMHLYSFKGTIKICTNDAHLNRVYNNIFGRDIQSCSFYASSANIIYISGEHFTSGVLGHEIAHAVISMYFVVPPPQRAAEILSGYVEYELRKTSKN
jgi:hypothetical protein